MGWSPELPSDLEDSDRRLFAGSASMEPLSSPYAGGQLEEGGRFGSLNVTLCFLNDKEVAIDFRLSFFAVSRPPGVSCGSSRDSSPDRRNRLDSLMREGFFCGILGSKVGAVVMISGAIPKGEGRKLAKTCYPSYFSFFFLNREERVV